MRKRVWHLLSNPWGSAITQYALHTAQALKDKGYQCALTPLTGSPAEKSAKELRIPSMSIKNFSAFSFPKLLAYHKEINPDYIFVYGGKETSFTKTIKHPRIIRFRGDARDKDTNPKSFSYRFSQGHIKAILTPCNVIAENFKDAGAKLASIPLGIDEKKFNPKFERKPEGRINLHLIARLDPIKGHREFLKLFSKLLIRWKEPKRPFLNFLGQEENLTAKELRESSEGFGLVPGRDFQITPYRVNNIENVYSQTDLIVIPSLGSEVICRVAEESLMCGTKIFVSGAGALEETLLHDGFGSSYKGLNESESLNLFEKTLLKASTESLADKEERSKLATEAFSLKTMGNSLEKFLLELS